MSLWTRSPRWKKKLLDELDAQQEKFHYHLEGTRVKFEQEILDAHRKLKIAVLTWLFSSKVRSIISAPFIYAMIVPILFFDITITLY